MNTAVCFKRCSVVLGSGVQTDTVAKSLSSTRSAPALPGSEVSVLLINASHDMAKEITLQLQLAIPGCSIMYAPTLALSECILKKRKIDLVVSSSILPDGGIKRLRESINALSYDPDVMIVGEIQADSENEFTKLGYHYVTKKKLALQPSYMSSTPIIHKRKVDASIKSIGADLRNDLNNPLQEIVALVFVAQKQTTKNVTTSALEAIDTAAKNLAQVVRGIEDKIRSAVQCAEDFELF